jgi:hypothetical protein
VTDDIRQCHQCGEPTRPGKWRCDACQAIVDGGPPQRHLRLVTLPGTDASDASRARHPSAQPDVDP